jgi:hypothetical protein
MSDTDDKKQPEEEPKTPDTGDDGKDFRAEAEKWKSLARKHEAKAKENAEAAKRLADLEEAGKSEAEKAAAKAAEAEKRAADAELRAMKLEVAVSKGLTPSQAKRLVGSTKEELESDADDLLESFKPADDKGKPSGKPNERLKGGTDPTEDPEEMDPRKLADMVPRY